MNNFRIRNKKSNEKEPIVLFNEYDWKITLREVLFSIFIFGILMFCGSLISVYIKSYIHNKNLIYRQAVQIKNNPNEFKWALETDIGNAFVEGELKVSESVTHNKLGINVISYNATYQHYNKHTRPVTRTRTDSKGRTHTYTTIETYWSWDTYKHEKNNVTKVNFLDVEFDYSKFNLNNFYKSKTIDNGYHDRILFRYIPTNVNGSFFCEIKDKKINGIITLHNVTLEKLYEGYTTSHFNIIFWIFWIIISIILIVIFYIGENYWLEK
jgi:hypothetical protein